MFSSLFVSVNLIGQSSYQAVATVGLMTVTGCLPAWLVVSQFKFNGTVSQLCTVPLNSCLDV